MFAVTFVNVALQDICVIQKEGEVSRGGDEWFSRSSACESAHVRGRAGKMGERVIPTTKSQVDAAVVAEVCRDFVNNVYLLKESQEVSHRV